MDKTCNRCREAKPLLAFYPHAQMADGHLNACKDCVKARVRRHRLDNVEEVRAYDRIRSRLPKVIQRKSVKARAYRIDNPERYSAHTKVSSAMKRGKLTKEPCYFCGADNTEAHHHDYNKPLEVTWLCKACHRKFHLLERLSTYEES